MICTVLTPAIGPFNRDSGCDEAHNGLLDTRGLANARRLAERFCACFWWGWCDY